MQNHGWLLLWTHYLVDLHEFVGFVTWCFYAWLQQSWGIVLCCYLVVQLLAFLPCFQKSTLREEKHFCCNRLPFMDFVRYVQWSPLKNGFLHLKTSKLNKHDAEISWFFYHSDFTWNQFTELLKCKICHFFTFRGSEFWSLMNFPLFEG